MKTINSHSLAHRPVKKPRPRFHSPAEAVRNLAAGRLLQHSPTQTLRNDLLTRVEPPRQPPALLGARRSVFTLIEMLPWLAALVLSGFVQTANAFILGPAFTYHGRLQSDAVPVSGTYDLTFSLYTNGTGGTAVEGPITNSATAINNGVFTARLDFGSGVFDGTAYWLEIGVRTNGDGAFTILSPRHELLATPYAVYAESARAGGLDGVIPEEALKGTYGHAVNLTNPGNAFVGDGSALTGVDAKTVGGLASSDFWNISGNAGTAPLKGNFLGTTDNHPLELHVNNMRALRLEPTATSSSYSNLVNMLGGSPNNFIAAGVYGGTIAGGGALTYITGGIFSNSVTADFGTVSGGRGNIASCLGATVAGGEMNSSGGIFTDTTVGGGNFNVANGSAATVAGGNGNTASGEQATIPGGNANLAGGMGSFAAGQFAQTTREGCFVWGDGSENPFQGPAADNAFNVLASGGVFFYNGTNGVHADCNDKNNGNIQYGLRFGAPLTSGEGIASKRTGGGNQFGLDFYTASANRLSIDKFGNVGIGTNNPQAQLEVNGSTILLDGSGGEEAFFSGNLGEVYVGSLNPTVTAVQFFNIASFTPMHVYCGSITIQGGADLAEPFPIADDEGKQISQGSVVVIDEENPGQLKVSNRPYDSRVAGVVSGANGINPGIQMQQQGLLEGGKNVALTGRVYVHAEAIDGAIKPGDLLTTSNIPGHAMKAADHARAQGAILGKAMTGLDQGKGMVLVLVTLQ